MDQLRQLADQWKAKAASDVLVLATAVSKDKVNLIVGVSPQALKAGLKAGALIKAIAPKVGGGGGGRQIWLKLVVKILKELPLHLRLLLLGCSNWINWSDH